ncbi:MAG: HDOD domain-containing protein [Candidatus Hydrogenedentes bacterium]|nr:HDOD domain-containing protein [Candidatus Hydrogenedentota bacterium]
MLVIMCGCGQRMKGPPGLLGKTVKCVRCGEHIEVSERNTAPLGGPVPAPHHEQHKEKHREPPRLRVDRSSQLIGEMLVEDGLIDRAQLDEALAVQTREGGRILQILMALGYTSKAEVHEFLSKQPGIASIDLKSYFIPRDLISLVPKEIAQECLVLPIDRLGRLLTVGMACPLDKETISRLEQITGLTVKPMLCKFDDILATIDRYYPGETALAESRPEEGQETGPEVPTPKEPVSQVQAPEAPTSVPPTPTRPPARQASRPSVPASALPVTPMREDIVERFVRIDALPTFADTVDRIRATMEGEKGSVRALAAVISGDPPVVAKMLSVANALAYGLPGKVIDANLATALLGVDGVCEVAMLSVIAGNHYDSPILDYEHFLARSRFCAVAARALAEEVDPGVRFTAYAAGLLHAVGTLALAASFPKRAAELNGARSGAGRIEDELRVFGMGHPEAGALLAKEWGIPLTIGSAIGMHRDIQSAQREGGLAAVVALAAMLADCSVKPQPDPADAITEGKELLEVLNLTPGKTVAVFNRAVSMMSAS